MSLFIDQTKLIEIVFFIGVDKNNKEYIGNDSKFSGKEILSSSQYSMSFKYPSYSDNVKILEKAVKIINDGEIQINPVLMRYERFCQLLTKWSLIDDDGETMPINKENIDRLNPDIANFVINELEKVLS